MGSCVSSSDGDKTNIDAREKNKINIKEFMRRESIGRGGFGKVYEV
jgi:hypothetical protein